MSRKKTNEEYVEELKANMIHIINLEPYVDNKTRILHECLVCGKTWSVQPSIILRNGHVCKQYSKSNKDKIKYSYNIAIDEFEKHDYILLETEYKNSTTKMRYICKKHPDVVQTITLGDLINRHRRCWYCSYEERYKSQTHDIAYVRQRFIDGGVTPTFTSYNNSKDLLTFVCPHHPNVIQKQRLHKFRGCPMCKKESDGERLVRETLDTIGIRYELQYAFNGCKYKKQLFFDFYLCDFNMCIEYQGAQHYIPVDFGGCGKDFTKKKLDDNKTRDQIKRDFCKANNITLLEIPYWEFNNMEQIIKDKLKEVDILG